MLARCHDPASASYPGWGGKGVAVCDRWRASFDDFLTDVGRRPGPGYSLDRFPNNNGNYEPGNVRWATQVEQTSNMRNNVWLEARGERRLLAHWAKDLGVPSSLLAGWLKRQTLEEILASPPPRRGPRGPYRKRTAA